MAVSRSSFLVFMAVLSTPLQLIYAQETTPKRVAMFPLGIKGNVSKESAVSLQNIQNKLNEGPSSDTQLEIIIGDEIDQKLNKPALKAIAKCERVSRYELCLRRLVRKLDTDEIITGRFEANSNNVRLLILAIDQHGKVEVRANLVQATTIALESRMNPQQIAKIYDVTYKEKQKPVPEIAANETNDNKPQSIIDDSLVLTPPPTPSSNNNISNIVQTPPPKKPPIYVEKSHALRWTGLVIASVGMIAAGVGGYYSFSADSQGDITPDGTTTQRQAFTKYEAAQDKAKKGKWILVGGGALFAVGATLFVIDF
ncbi:MAG: hypothetical protein JW841_14345 [Deltaproteobacteria bacterium]|nr:hypothetical protein [Deltaproteobacteria bacterium]